MYILLGVTEWLQSKFDEIKDMIRGLVILLDSVGFSVLGKAYDLFAALANETLVNEDVVSQLRSNMYVIVGIFAFFRIAMLLINAVISPDALTKQGGGLSKVAVNVVLMIVFLIAVPTLFKLSRELSKVIVNGNYIQKVFTGSVGGDDFNPGATMERIGVSGIILPHKKFVENEDLNELEPGGECDSDECKNAIYCLQEIKDSNVDKGVGCLDSDGYVNWDELAEQNKAKVENGDKYTYVYNYRGFVLTVAGWFMAYVLVSFCFDIAKRMVELAVLEITAPLFIATIVDPKSMSGGTFQKWAKAVGSSYASLFIRQAGIAIMILCSQLLVNWHPLDTNVGFFGKFIILIGILIFVKGAPQWFGNLLGIDGSGLGGLGIGKKIAGAALVGGALSTAGRTAAAAASGAGRMLANNANEMRKRRKQVRQDEGLTHGKAGREKRQALSKEAGGYFAGRKKLHEKRKQAYADAGVNLLGKDKNNVNKKGEEKSAIGRNLGQLGASLVIGSISGGKAGAGANDLKSALKGSKDAARQQSDALGLNVKNKSGTDRIIEGVQNAWGSKEQRTDRKEKLEEQEKTRKFRASGTNYTAGCGEGQIPVTKKQAAAVGDAKIGTFDNGKYDTDCFAQAYAVTKGCKNVERVTEVNKDGKEVVTAYKFENSDGSVVQKSVQDMETTCGGIMSQEGAANYAKMVYTNQQEAVQSYSDNVQAQANAVSTYNDAASSYNNAVNSYNKLHSDNEQANADFSSKVNEMVDKLGDGFKAAMIAVGIGDIAAGSFKEIGGNISKAIDELNKGMAGRSDEEQQAIKKQIATLEDLKKESDEGAKKVEEESIYAEQAATFKNTMESSIGEIQAINQELSDLKSKVESVSGNTLSEKMQNVTKNISDQDKKLEIYKNDKKE